MMGIQSIQDGRQGTIILGVSDSHKCIFVSKHQMTVRMLVNNAGVFLWLGEAGMHFCRLKRPSCVAVDRGMLCSTTLSELLIQLAVTFEPLPYLD